MDKIASFQDAAAIPLFIGVDEEGGTVARASRNPNLFEKKFRSPREVYLEFEGGDGIRADAIEKSTGLLSYGINVNFAPVAWEGCVIGVPDASSYTVALSSDEARFGGSGKDPGRLKVDKKTPCHDFQQSITLDVPPMSALYLVGRPRPKRAPKEIGRAHV